MSGTPAQHTSSLIVTKTTAKSPTVIKSSVTVPLLIAFVQVRCFLTRGKLLVPKLLLDKANRALDSLKVLGRFPMEWQTFPAFQQPAVLCEPKLIVETLLIWKQTQLVELVRPAPWVSLHPWVGHGTLVQ